MIGDARPARRRSASSSRWTSRSNSVVLLIGLAVGVDYSMFYLRREMEERDAGRVAGGRARGRRRDLRPRRARLRPHRDDRDGRHVPRRQRRLHRRSRVGTILVVAVAVLGSLTVLPAVLSKLGDKVEKGRVPFLGRLRHRNHGESRVWGCDPRPRAAPPGRLGRRRRRLLRRARAPRAEHAHGQPGRRRACRATCRSCRPTTASRPRSPAARCRRSSSSRPTTSPRPRSQAGDRGRCSDEALATGQTVRAGHHATISPDKTVAVVVDPAARQRHRRRRPTPRSRRCATTSIPAHDRRASPASRPT